MFYDPLIGKVVTRGGGRAGSIGQMIATLGDMRVEGIKTNIETHLRVLQHEPFRSGDYDTGLLGK